MSEFVFEVVQAVDGGYCAECLTENIFTEADSWDELRRNVREAVTAFYFEKTAPASDRLHLVRDEILSVARNSHGTSLVKSWPMSFVGAGSTPEYIR